MNTVINISWKRMKMHKNKNKTQRGMDKKNDEFSKNTSILFILYKDTDNK